MFKRFILSLLTILLLTNKGFSTNLALEPSGASEPVIAVESDAPATEPQAGSYALSPVIITASSMALKLEDVTSSVTVITSEEIEQKQPQTLSQLLQNQISLDIVPNGGLGQLTGVFIRGAASDQTLILLDGMPLSDPSTPARNTDLSQISLDNVERIEIVRGPQSVLYGSSAMGGVINIITKQAGDTWQHSLSVSGGTYQTLISKLASRGRLGRFGLALGASLVHSEGFSAAKRSKEFEEQASEPLPAMDKDGYRQLSIDCNLDYRWSDQLQFKLNNRYLKSETELDNFNGDFGDDPNYVGQQEKLINQLIGRHRLLPGWEQTMTLGFNQAKRRYENDEDLDHPGEWSETDWHADQLVIDWRQRIDLASQHTLVIGTGYQQEQAEGQSFNQSPMFGTSSNSFEKRSAHQVDVYAEQFIRQSWWTSLVGVRVDRHDQFGLFPTFRMNQAVHHPEWMTKLSGSVGTAFKAPSLYQLYVDDSYTQGDPGLQPEQSFNWEVGLTQPLWDGSLTTDIRYFQSDYQQKIDAFYDSSTYKFNYVNIGKVAIEGVELKIQAQPVEQVKLDLFYNKLTANDITNEASQGKDPLLRRADYKIGLKANWQWQALNLNMAVTRFGPRWDKVYDSGLNDTVQKALQPYTMVDLAASYHVLPAVKLFATIHNLLDEDYELVAGYTTSRFKALVGTTIQWP